MVLTIDVMVLLHQVLHLHSRIGLMSCEMVDEVREAGYCTKQQRLQRANNNHILPSANDKRGVFGLSQPNHTGQVCSVSAFRSEMWHCPRVDALSSDVP
jgi:hypothetical protein